MTKKVFKLTDKSLIIGVEMESTATTVTIQEPINVAQIQNPQTGEAEIAFLPLDLIFADVQASKNNVELKKEFIMWDKPLSDFPNYEQNYIAQTNGIETVSNGIIS